MDAVDTFDLILEPKRLLIGRAFHSRLDALLHILIINAPFQEVKQIGNIGLVTRIKSRFFADIIQKAQCKAEHRHKESASQGNTLPKEDSF